MITKQQVQEKIKALASLPTHPRRRAKIKQLRDVEIIVSSLDESFLISQLDQVEREIKIIKDGMSTAVELMGKSLPEKTRRDMYIEDTQLRKKQMQALYIRYAITGKGIK